MLEEAYESKNYSPSFEVTAKLWRITELFVAICIFFAPLQQFSKFNTFPNSSCLQFYCYLIQIINPYLCAFIETRCEYLKNKQWCYVSRLVSRHKSLAVGLHGNKFRVLAGLNGIQNLVFLRLAWVLHIYHPDK